MPQDKRYPSPFPAQQRAWPALACRMNPPPDHGPGQPAEIAGLYVLPALDEASFTTGNAWGSTGGETGP